LWTVGCARSGGGGVLNAGNGLADKSVATGGACRLARCAAGAHTCPLVSHSSWVPYRAIARVRRCVAHSPHARAGVPTLREPHPTRVRPDAHRGGKSTAAAAAAATAACSGACHGPPGAAANDERACRAVDRRNDGGRRRCEHPSPALSLITPVNGNTVRSFSTHGQLSAAQGSSTTVSRSDIRLIQHLDGSALGLVRRWRLIGFFPILYYPSPALNTQRS
jgi:hypothetical protein